MNTFKDMLSTRSKNGLARCFGRDVLDRPEEIAAAGSERLRMTVQLGSKSINEIALVLHIVGCIDDVDVWLMRLK